MSDKKKSYTYFIDTFLFYQRLFEYSGTINDILAMSYPLYNDTIVKQISLRKKEREELNKKMK